MGEQTKFYQNDLCGIHLHSLTSQGHVLIAKVLKISNEIPPCFRYDYTPQKHAAASLTVHYEKSALSSSMSKSMSSMWKKMRSKKTAFRILRRQVPSYTESCDSGGKNKPPMSLHADMDKVTDADTAVAVDMDMASEQSTMRYRSILVDFAYLTDPEKYDSHMHILQGEETEEDRRKKIIRQEHLEREFIQKFETILMEFHDIFSNVLRYYRDICRFADELEEGFYVQYTVDSLLQHSHGRQLLCELLYLYGTILILLDLYIPGPIRERLIIAKHRYCSSSNSNNATNTTNNFEQLCKLLQRTDLEDDSKKGMKKAVPGSIPIVPEHYFTRMPISPSLTEKIIACLMTHDIYPIQELSFPSHLHESTKLSKQASMIFVLLYFQPNIFNQKDKIRPLVDKFFGDNWMVPLYNGEIVDLSVEWDKRFPVAQHTLENVLSENKIHSLNVKNARQIELWRDEIRRYLNQNILTDLYALEHVQKLNDCMRNANVALRWRILHRASTLLIPPKQTSSSTSVKAALIDEDSIVDLFLLTSAFETTLKEAYGRLVEKKSILWTEFKNNAVTRMQQLSTHFKGNNNLDDVEKNDDIAAWFGKMGTEIDNLVFNESCEDIQFCNDALNEIKTFDLIDRNSQVKRVILETELDLLRMVKSESIRKDLCSVVDNIADFGYARGAMEYYVPIFRSRSVRDPRSVGLLRSSFLKMASFLRKIPDHPLKNIADVKFTKDFHSNALLYFVKEILDVIPISIFSTYAMIVETNEKSLARLPTKIDIDALADHSHFDDRYKLAKLTYELSILTKGIIDMDETLIGDLKMNPRQLLEEGLRKELVRQISITMHENLQFPARVERSRKTLAESQKTIIQAFSLLSRRMEGFQRAIIWLQDFLRIDGLEIYLQESTRVIWHNIFIELGNNEVSPSIASAVPIPCFPRTEEDPKSNTFMGRILTATVRLVDPKFTSFSRSLDGWFSHEDGKAVLDLKTLALIRRAIGVQGIIGMESLICHKITKELESFLKFYDSATTTYGIILERFRDGIFPEWQIPKHGQLFYTSAVAKTGKLMVPLLSFIGRIGQLQLLRRMIRAELRLGSRIDSTELLQASIVVNGEMMSFLRENQGCELSPAMTKTIKKAADIHESLGGGDPISTIFKKMETLEGLPALITMFVIHYMPNVRYDPNFQALRGKEDESFDSWSVVTGIGTLLRQFNPAYIQSTFALLGQYINCSMMDYVDKLEIDESSTGIFKKEAMNCLVVMRQLRSICNLDRSVLYDHVPQYMMEMYDLIE